MGATTQANNKDVNLAFANGMTHGLTSLGDTTNEAKTVLTICAETIGVDDNETYGQHFYDTCISSFLFVVYSSVYFSLVILATCGMLWVYWLFCSFILSLVLADNQLFLVAIFVNTRRLQ